MQRSEFLNSVLNFVCSQCPWFTIRLYFFRNCGNEQLEWKCISYVEIWTCDIQLITDTLLCLEENNSFAAIYVGNEVLNSNWIYTCICVSNIMSNPWQERFLSRDKAEILWDNASEFVKELFFHLKLILHLFLMYCPWNVISCTALYQRRTKEPNLVLVRVI